MPTDDMTAISAKVRTVEKALFEQLCETEGLTPSKAIQTSIMDRIAQGRIAEMKDQDARYMARYGILQMR